jgi:voltage-dependent potassium channel beta subunit
VIGFGNWLTSDKEEDHITTKNLLKKAYDAGINFFDTAEGYGLGKGEIAFGKALKELNFPREQLVISTKIYFGGYGPNDKGLSRKHVIEGTKNSLKRLQLDYVDVLFCHRPDYNTPVEETCRAFDYVINQGWAFYWGTSEWSAQRIQEAIGVCDRLGLVKPVVEQCQYSAFVRERFEKEYSLLFKQYQFGTTVWSPLAGGILSGKYNTSIPEGTRFDSDNPVLKMIFDKFFSETKKEETFKKLQAFGDIAKELDCSQAQLALAWTLYSKNVSVALFGATKEAQLDDNLKAIKVVKKLNDEIMERIDKIFDNKPEPDFDFRNMVPTNFPR